MRKRSRRKRRKTLPLRLSIAALGALLGIGATTLRAADGQLGEVFVLDSTVSTYPFSMRLEGTTTRKGDELIVELKGGLVRSTIPAEYKGEGLVTHVVIAFGLGIDTDKGWQLTKDDNGAEVAAELRPEESLPVTRHRFVIRGLDESRLAGQWLAARLTVTQKLPGIPPGPLSSYACSVINLLGETTGSKDRKKRMAENYAHAC